jgi:3'-phosphoadenosine 5'-phosphosulfate (PAPS) 3'-phosphatase
VTISIAEVIEEAAQLAEGWDSGAPIAKDIRALAAQYEGCIVAEGEADAYRWVDHSGFCGSPLTRYADVAPGHLETAAVPLYRAKEPTK